MLDCGFGKVAVVEALRFIRVKDVFQQGDDAGTDASDVLVLLEGQGSTDALIITTNTAGVNDLFIA